MKTRQKILINATAKEIFEYLMKIENRKNYIPALDEVVLLDPLPIQKGSRYIEVAEIAGRRLETTYQVIEYEVNKHTAVHTIKSIFPIRADLDLMETADYTELCITLDFKLSGIFKLASGIVQGIVNQQTISILKRIKQNVEALD